MTLTEEQRALYRAVADGKRVEFRLKDSPWWTEWMISGSSYVLGYDGVQWRIAPQTITITIPRPNTWGRTGDAKVVWIGFKSESDAQAFIDAVRGAK